MLDVALEKDLIELLADSLKTNQMEELGRLVFGDFDVHKELGEHRHITIPPRRAAEAMLHHCRKRDCYAELIHLLVETDGARFLGRTVTLDGIELFLENLTKTGVVYDFEKRRLNSIKSDPSQLPNWGSLRDGRSYPISIASIDIADNSQLVRKNGMRKVRKLYFRFRQLLDEKLRKYNGRVWNWSGDGGIVAFTFKNHEIRAVQFAFELQRTLPIFNSFTERGIDAELAIRIGIDAGKLRFANDTGSIVSEVINFAAHLEKQSTPAGQISVSNTVYAALPPRLAAAFSVEAAFEGRAVRRVPTRLDRLIEHRTIA